MKTLIDVALELRARGSRLADEAADLVISMYGFPGPESLPDPPPPSDDFTLRTSDFSADLRYPPYRGRE